MRPGLSAQFDADPSRGTVRHQHRHRERGDPLPALFLERVVGGQGGADPADAAGDRDAEPFRVDLGLAGVRPRFPGGDQGELLAAVHPAGLHASHDLDRVGRCDAGDPGREILGPVVGQRFHAAAPGQHR
jgi:hypothetical protein